jgi:para-aminobenzoate synthetase component 1
MQHCAILPAMWRDPVEVLGAFADEPFAVALLSGGANGEAARWSYVARKPRALLTIAPGDQTDPFDALAELAGEEAAAAPDGPPFQGGVIGHTAYELGARSEPVPLERKAGWPDLICGLYEAVLAFDHREGRVLAVGRGASAAAAGERAREALGWLAAPAGEARGGVLGTDFASDDGPAYEEAVRVVTSAIAAGDLFQANIARVWRGRLAPGVRPYDLMRRLAADSPAPFAAYLRLVDRAVVSNSPERFVRLTRDDAGLLAESRPIKGTARRDADPGEDAALASALLASVKDRAENLMIVDLMRNDLARVCAAGGVEVAELFRLETYPNVHHLVSTVTGRMADGRRAPDLLRAAFPPGSITGAPKVQAMKTIAALESPRGPYCGAVFWLGLDGAFDSSVLIRTLACEADGDGWAIEARAGAGIVADSDPLGERLETEAKIDAIRKALS